MKKIEILIKKMVIGDKDAENKLVTCYGYTENDITRLKKYRYQNYLNTGKW